MGLRGLHGMISWGLRRLYYFSLLKDGFVRCARKMKSWLWCWWWLQGFRIECLLRCYFDFEVEIEDRYLRKFVHFDGE